MGIDEADDQQLISAIHATVAAAVSDLIVACDRSGRLVYSNAAAAAFIAGRVAQVDGELHAEMVKLRWPDRTPLLPEESPWTRVLRGEDVRDLELILVSRTDAELMAVATGHLIDAPGQDAGAVVIFHDVSRQRMAEQALALSRHVDSVTGLPDRTVFTERVGLALQRAPRNGWGTAVLAVDIDDFRVINDRFGHDPGDELLAEAARRLESAVRPYDLVSRPVESVTRLGGDEFLVICEHVASESIGLQIADRLTAALAVPLTLGGQLISVSACIGITISKDEDATPDALITEAETALRRAKGGGPGTRELYGEAMKARVSARLEGEAALRSALDHGEFRVVYQPKVSLVTERVVGVEALLRWEHPQRGPVQPLEFIPLAEESGLIVPIGAWVLEQACLEARRWREVFPEPFPFAISVNVSGRQFDSGLTDLFGRIISTSGVDPRMLCVEVTESTVMSNPTSAIRTLRALRDLGVRISIDDFGTGYSSLAYLRRFPLNELKVDKSFVDGLGRDAEATAIIAAVMGMAHALDLSVVAEGVETAGQLSVLRGLGCDEAQGYYYARPQTADDISLLLREGGSLGERLQPGPRRTIDVGVGIGTILVVDDAADVRQLARVSLAAAGFEVHDADRGDSALAIAGNLLPDCIVLDLNMPGMGGLEVCRALRADPRTSEMTIVMLTADANAPEKVEAFQLDADDYIVKPFAPRDLVARVTVAMRRRREASGSAGTSVSAARPLERQE